MARRTPKSNLTDTLFPYTTLVRAPAPTGGRGHHAAPRLRPRPRRLDLDRAGEFASADPGAQHRSTDGRRLDVVGDRCGRPVRDHGPDADRKSTRLNSSH